MLGPLGGCQGHMGCQGCIGGWQDSRHSEARRGIGGIKEHLGIPRGVGPLGGSGGVRGIFGSCQGL